MYASLCEAVCDVTTVLSLKADNSFERLHAPFQLQGKWSRQILFQLTILLDSKSN